MKKTNSTHLYNEKSLPNNLAVTSTHFLKGYSNEFDIRPDNFIKRKKNPINLSIKKKYHNMNATFFIKKNLIFESIKDPLNPINSLWKTKNYNNQKCDFFPFIQERDHLNRLIQINV